MNILKILESAAEESKLAGRGVYVWENGFFQVETGLQFPSQRSSDCIYLCVVCGDETVWARRV